MSESAAFPVGVRVELLVKMSKAITDVLAESTLDGDYHVSKIPDDELANFSMLLGAFHADLMAERLRRGDERGWPDDDRPLEDVYPIDPQSLLPGAES